MKPKKLDNLVVCLRESEFLSPEFPFLGIPDSPFLLLEIRLLPWDVQLHWLQRGHVQRILASSQSEEMETFLGYLAR